MLPRVLAMAPPFPCPQGFGVVTVLPLPAPKNLTLTYEHGPFMKSLGMLLI